jgi:hypothetical protein
MAFILAGRPSTGSGTAEPAPIICLHLLMISVSHGVSPSMLRSHSHSRSHFPWTVGPTVIHHHVACERRELCYMALVLILILALIYKIHLFIKP